MGYVFMLAMVIFNVMMYIGYKHDLNKETPVVYEAIRHIKQKTGDTYTIQQIARRAFIFNNMLFGAITYIILSIVQWAVGS
jgi:hypothetical protein